MSESDGQQPHSVNPSNMLASYKARLSEEMEARLLAETGVGELMNINQALRNQIAELQRAKEASDLQFSQEIDKLREEVSSLPDMAE